MTQSALTSQAGLHVAVIMDGNGRWATARGLPRTAGHVRGAEAVRRTVEAAPDLGIRTLSLYAFSSDNWRRPTGEVRVLLRLFARHLRSETPTLAARGVRLRVIGRRDRLPGPLVAAIERAERRTAGGRALELRIARSEEHTSELLSHHDLVCRLLLEKKKKEPQFCIRSV